MGGLPPIGFPTDAEMRRLEREPRLPRPALEFWRAYRRYDWHHELKSFDRSKLIYAGTADARIKQLRRLRTTLQGIGCTYLEFEGRTHATSALSSPDGEPVVQAVTNWLRG